MLFSQRKKLHIANTFESLTEREKCIVNSTIGKHAGGWLRAIPSSKYLRMNDIRMCMALKLFLDLPIIPPDDGACIVCKEHFDGTFAEHMLRCKCKGIRNSRHNAIRDNTFENEWTNDTNKFFLFPFSYFFLLFQFNKLI